MGLYLCWKRRFGSLTFKCVAGALFADLWVLSIVVTLVFLRINFLFVKRGLEMSVVFGGVWCVSMC